MPSRERVAEAIAKVSPMLSADEQNALVDEKVKKMAEPGFFEAFASMMKTMADHRNRKEYVLTRRLPHTPVPTLFLIGRGDPSSDVTDKLKEMTPGSQVYIIETGAHQVHYENTEEFCKAAMDFLG
jgi:pimeloyl-ACP methyl ester carboxylesterase